MDMSFVFLFAIGFLTVVAVAALNQTATLVASRRRITDRRRLL
jgi:hypothetical protein